DPAARKRLMTFVVVGGGPTGVEMAGAISDLARLTLRRDFRAIDPTAARIVLAEGQGRVLSTFHEKLSRKAKEALERMGVEVMLDCHVTDIEPDRVTIKPDGGKALPTTVETETIVWAAGVKASALGKLIADAVGGVAVDRAGR